MQKIKNLLGWFWKDKKRLLILAVLLVVAFFILRGRSSASKPTYQTEKVQRGTIISTVTASGHVLSANTMTVTTGATGVVKKVYVKEGDKVYAGQTIAQLTLDTDGAVANAKAWASLVSAQDSYNSANNNYRGTQAALQNIYDQVKGHDSDETPAQKDLRTKAEVSNDNAFDSVKGAQANLASAGLSYRQTSPTITAGMSGIISSINVVPGMVLSSNATSTTATSSQTIAAIKGTGTPIVSVNLTEINVPKIKVDQKVTLTFDSIPDKTYTGHVATVDRVGITSSSVTNYPINIILDTDSSEILPNMAANANIILETKTDVLLAPTAAIQTQNGQTSARTLKNGVEVDVPVEVGISSDTQEEIISGVSEGDEVITGTVRTGAAPPTTRSVFSGGFGGGGGGNVRVGR